MTDSDNTQHPADSQAAMDPALRARLLAATTAHIRRGRRKAQALRAAALLAAFAGGVALTLAMRPAPVPQMNSSPALSTVAANDEPPVEPTPAIVDAAALFSDPEALAFAYDRADDAGKLHLLKEAGDHELSVNQDIRAALDYYRQWIVLADAATRQTYDETDTWLLASLKHTP